MMYQEKSDISTRMMSVPLATKSPCCQRADRPYGLSTVAVGVVSIRFPRSKKRRALACPALTSSVFQFELDLEGEAVGGRLAIDRTRDIASGLGKLQRAFIEPRAARGLGHLRLFAQLAIRSDADLDGDRAFLAESLRRGGVVVLGIREVLAHLRVHDIARRRRRRRRLRHR